MELRDVFAIVFVSYVVQCAAMSISELEDFANFLKKTSKLDETLKKGTDSDEHDEDETVSDHAWEDSGKFEGDLILNDRQRRMIVEEIAEGLSRNGLRDSTKKWPDNEVIYYIQKEHFNEDQVNAIRSGIEDLAQASCISFRPYQKGDKNAVVIQGSRRGCFSQVGYQGGYQVLNLSGRHPVGRGCFRHGTVVHELLHTLGFYHMQSSPDRDDYVNVVWENIVQPARHNFRKYNAFAVSDFGVGYDYDSVLHYSRRAFSSNGQDTIVPKQSGAQIGQRAGLSDKDAQKLNKMYCDADSNSEGEENTTKKAVTKKKTPKNKPFDGHGIGYHQGKTVVIKLLPEKKAETYNIIIEPQYSLFDHFSKAPQTLSAKKIEGVGKPIEDFDKSFNIEDIFNRVKSKVPTYMTEKSRNKNGEVTTDANNKAEIDTKKSMATLNDKPEQTNIETLPNGNDELTDPFDRLSKILKTHVYPSQMPDFGIYKFNTDYSNYANPSNLPNLDYKNIRLYSDKLLENYKNSTPEYIKSLYSDGPVSLTSEKHQQNHERLKIDPNQDKDIDQQQNISKEDKSYRSSHPFKNHQNDSNESYETKIPAYTTFEHLENINNFSDFYKPHSEQVKTGNKNNHKLFGETVPVYDDWYQKQESRQNPVDYNRGYDDTHKKYTKENKFHDTSSVEYEPESSNEYYTESYLPHQKVAYTLFGVPVALTREWYKDYNYSPHHDPHQSYNSKRKTESDE
ncbi:hypothetical protein evm_013435 [Chilo suppressalis]|nr:hypothetical protein evm_013435 [Chilo suppressalis]